MRTFQIALAVGVGVLILYPIVAAIAAWVLAPIVIREAERIVEG